MSDRSAGERLKIAIVGAGLGGLTAASALNRVGIEARVFEQAHQFARVGAGIQMPPNAMKVLRAIGAERRVREIGLEPMSNLNLEHDTGKVTNDLPLAAVAEAKYGAPFVCIHRADLHATLAGLLAPGCVRLAAKLTGFEQDARGVTVVLEDGAREQFDALVGADGVHSFVREALFGPQEVTSTGRVAYRATYPSSRLDGLTFPRSRIKWWGPDKHAVAYYTRRALDEFYVTTVQSESAEWITKESWSAKGDLEQVLDSFREFHGDLLTALRACPAIYKWAIQERQPMPRWSEGRVTLLGDACHAMTPHMAQGGAQAIEDAAILARCLDGVDRDGIEASLQRYEAIRRPRTSKIQAMAAHNTWMRTPTNPDWVFCYDALTAPLEPG